MPPFLPFLPNDAAEELPLPLPLPPPLQLQPCGAAVASPWPRGTRPDARATAGEDDPRGGGRTGEEEVAEGRDGGGAGGVGDSRVHFP
jgi:hypothetical protein